MRIVFRRSCVYNNRNSFPIFYFTRMVYTSTDFICLDISKLLVFLIFCLSDLINNRKSNVDTISKTTLADYHNKVSSPHSAYRKNVSFRTHAGDDFC